MAAVRMYTPPARKHKRANMRWDRQRPSSRGAGATDDHGSPDPSPGPATGATAGIPGSWTPTGARPPDDIYEMGDIVANPATPWTTGQYVECFDGSDVTWSGTDWVGGRAP